MDHSEVKHLPKVDHTPAELDAASRLMLKAADLMERRGMAKNITCDKEGRVCVRGALLMAEGIAAPRFMGLDRAMMFCWNDAGPDAVEADERLFKNLGFIPATWNNAPERTKDEVVAKLRAVALGL